MMAIIAVGIISRLVHTGFVVFDKYLGDALYAAMVYMFFRLLWKPSASVVYAMLAMTAIESFQLTMIPAHLLASKHLITRICARLMGTQFSFLDLLLYAVGIGLIWLMDSSSAAKRWIVTLTVLATLTPLNLLAEIIDHHQHLFSPEAAERSSPGWKGIDADRLIAELDTAGISRAVVLSVAYGFSNPNKPPVSDEYAHVMADNDWTSAQVAKYPQRLIGFCSVNPVRPYALEEIARCAKDPNLRTGLKLHFGNSDVDVDNPDHLARLRRVFRAANDHRMAIVVHMHANIDHNRPYGAKEAQVFLEKLLPEAPNVVVQIAHLAGGGGYDDPTTDAALSVFVRAIERKDPRMKNVYFDVSGIAITGMWEDKAALLVQRIRQIGTSRLLYGSDAAVATNLPKDALKRWRSLPLTQQEFKEIENNEAPYLRK